MRVEGFKKWRERENIELIALDGDDTLWRTVPIFRKMMRECYDYLSVVAPIANREEWKARIERVNDEMFETHGVNPTRWQGVMARVAAETHLAPVVRDEAVRILMQIYETPPEFIDGSEEGLAFLKETGTYFGIITHADPLWMERKYRWLGLERFLERGAIYVVDMNGHKVAGSWRGGIRYLGGRPDLTVAAGDSPRSDIGPAIEAGVKPEHCFLVESQGANRWSIHDIPVDKRVVRIPSILALRDLE